MPSPYTGVAGSSLSRWEREGGAQRRKGEGRRLLSSVLTFLPSFPRRRESRPATVSQAPQGLPLWIPAFAEMTGRMGRVSALIFTGGTAPWRAFADRVPHIPRHPGRVPGSTLRLGGRQEAQATPSRPGGPRTKSGVTAGVWLSAALTLTACAPAPGRAASSPPTPAPTRSWRRSRPIGSPRSAIIRTIPPRPRCRSPSRAAIPRPPAPPKR